MSSPKITTEGEASLGARWRARLAALGERMDDFVALDIDTASLRDLTVLWNDGTYLLLAAEASDRLELAALASLRDAFCDDRRRARLISAVESSSGDAEFEALRDELLEAWRRHGNTHAMAVVLLERLAAAEQDHRHFLERLGVGVDVDPEARAEDTYLRLVSSDMPAPTRRKLGDAWSAHRMQVLDNAVRAVDTVVDARRAADATRSVADATFSRAGITIDDARTFLDDFIAAAQEDRRRLDAEVAARLGAGHDTCDLPRLLRIEAMRAPSARYDAAQVIETAVGLAARSLDVDVAWVEGERLEHAEVLYGGELCGEIRIDRINGTPARAFDTRTAGHLVPSASVLCVTSARDGVATMSAHAVQTMLHEVGHAMHHVLLTGRRPSDGGLDYAPLERLDLLSMWFEQWVQHPVIAACADDAEAAERARWVTEMLHRRTLVERGVYASFDLELHSEPARDAASTFAEISDRHGVDELVVADILSYLTWPMQQRNPGGEIAILWGWAAAAHAFAPYRTRPATSLERGVSALLDGLDPQTPCPPMPAHYSMEFLRR